MVKGRNTSVISVRVPDDFLAKFKAEANKRGKSYTVLVRELMYKGIGMSPPSNKVTASVKTPFPH
ncbi:MAG: hypothetical protein P3T54_04570 [Dehalogenimonas sp.]|uniref:Ribbon-helix-helix protein CopG domain-containing protein n=1 Tax=Candidatus Dehalogenimonas loeffleri TaxID=3127115 RepID=A0ABZ2J8Q8_9CHLR|nr:hypothetical protein [Dehalogenimonas sp.]